MRRVPPAPAPPRRSQQLECTARAAAARREAWPTSSPQQWGRAWWRYRAQCQVCSVSMGQPLLRQLPPPRQLPPRARADTLCSLVPSHPAETGILVGGALFVFTALLTFASTSIIVRYAASACSCTDPESLGGGCIHSYQVLLVLIHCCRLILVPPSHDRCAGMHQTAVSGRTVTLCGITLGGQAPPCCSWPS